MPDVKINAALVSLFMLVINDNKLKNKILPKKTIKGHKLSQINVVENSILGI